MQHGLFTISLDTELHWGVSDCKTVEDYFTNLNNTRKAIDAMLQCFVKYNMHTTWATVGFLFYDKKKDLLALVEQNKNKPTYNNPALNNYNLLEGLKDTLDNDPFHFGLDIVQKIKQTPGQEIATHTCSHYYCLEDGQTSEQFAQDLHSALQAAEKEEVALHSIVFPRNQYNANYLAICKTLGIKTYRGNEQHWLYAPRKGNNETLIRRALRLLDSYLPLSGYHIHTISHNEHHLPLNIPASCFLRPYTPSRSLFDNLKLQRIKKGMEMAAKEKKLYHLWWHPHNFGNDVDRNIQQLEELLKFFDSLRTTYGMQSLSMKEIAEQPEIWS